jgi:hypothetical protein
MTQCPAQKLKDKKIKVHYIDLPEQKLPADYKTYSVNVYGATAQIAGLVNSTLAKKIKLDGYKRLDGKHGKFGHLRIRVNTGTLRTGFVEYRSQIRTYKDKDGNEISKTYYWYNIPFTGNTSFSIIDPEGNILIEEQKNYSTTERTREFTSASQLRKEKNRLIESERKSFARKMVNKIVDMSKKTAVSQFDYAHVFDNRQFYIVTKYSGEPQYQKFFDKTKSVLEKADPAMPASELKIKLSDVISFWEKEGSKNPGGDKKMKDVFKAANTNLAYIYYYLDDFDNARKHAQLVIKSEGKDRDCKKLLDDIEADEIKMQLHQIYSKHYYRDLSTALAPTEIEALESEQAEISDENNMSSGSIILNGEKIIGSFLMDKSADQMVFGTDGNTQFAVQADSEMQVYDLTDENITSFIIGDRQFNKIQFAPCAKGKSELRLRIMEEVYISGRIQLFKYSPTSGALGNNKSEYAFQKESDIHPVSLLDTQFLLWDKGLTKYFEDCSDLSIMCQEGSFEMTTEDLIRAARIYSEICD